MASNEVSSEAVTAAMRAFEPLSAVLRYRESDRWHTCDILAMRAALVAARPHLFPIALGEWQPIGTAPKDGTPILMIDDHTDSPTICRWDGHRWSVTWDSEEYSAAPGLRWLPLNLPARVPA